jgi:hypothetical protein
MNPLMKLVLALEEHDVIPRMDATGAMEAHQGLIDLEAEGWQFIPPPDVKPTQ